VPSIRRYRTPCSIKRDRRWVQQVRRFEPALMGLAAGLGAFAAVAAGLFKVSQSAQLGWAALASVATAALTFQQARKQQAGREARRHRSVSIDSDEGVSGHLAAGSLLGAEVHQLPPDIRDFTDREELLARLRELLTETRQRRGAAAVAVVVITGKPGVGKTALAIRAAHQVANSFVDGQLFASLRVGELTVDPSEVLARFLRALGVRSRSIPASLEERSALCRSLLAGRHVLVVLDDAASTAQVRPLLPGSSTCAVVLTASTFFIEGAIAVGVDVLEPPLSLSLLASIAGSDRILAEPEAAARIADLCGHLPIALRIAGGRLAARSEWSLSWLAERLADERRRLSELRIGDLEVRAMLSLEYHNRGSEEQRIFRLLGLLEMSDFASWVPAALADLDLHAAEDLVERLVDAHLLEIARQDPTGQTRYRFHDLLRVFARERLRVEETATAQYEALERALRTYALLAQQASDLSEPGGLRYLRDDAAARQRVDELQQAAPMILHDPLRWFAAEQTNLVMAVGRAYESHQWELTWQLAATLAFFFEVHSDWSNWRGTHELGLLAARETEDAVGEASMLRSLGRLYWYEGRFDDALASFEQALPVFREAGQSRLLAWTLRNLGTVHQQRGRYEDALASFEQALPVFRETEDLRGEAWTLRPLGEVHREQGRNQEAIDSFQRAVVIFRRLDDRLGEALATVALGDTYRVQGQHDQAATRLEQALPVFRRFGDRHAEAVTLRSLGDVYADQGRYEDGLTSMQQALLIFREFGDRYWEAKTQTSLGRLLAARGDQEGARGAWRNALEVFQDLDVEVAEAARIRSWLQG
jgi:tetratricopeptide (TPR) repeat protein